MQLEIITPVNKVFSGSVKAVSLPGSEGIFQVLPGHAPIVSSLKKGMVKVDLEKGWNPDDNLHSSVTLDNSSNHTFSMEIQGGVAELLHDKIIVLVE
jgi:F-type H+-transporting ATPase subunit epsilon